MPNRRTTRGFAAMNQAKQREIASLGGAGVAPEKRSFSQDRMLAKEAGRIGGKNVPAQKRSFARSRELAQAAGRLGGRARKV
jgi:uncharacterized protein